ncbi:MAG: glycerate kinase [Thermoplasmata archaeon]
MNIDEMRDLAKEMILEAVKAADPEKLVRDSIKVEENTIKIAGKKFNRNDYEEVVVFAIGKASVAMATGCDKLDPDDGLVITKSGEEYDEERCPVKVRKANHPYPKEANIEATNELLSKVKEKENALFVFMVSGGGSALFLSPVEGITLSEMNTLNKLLVKSGANIHEINAVRKHVSEVKGGRFGDLCSSKGDIVSLIISDVVGDDLSVIASGPTYPDDSTFEDAERVLKEYDLWEDVPDSIRKHIEEGLKGNMNDTPTDLNVDNYLIGNNLLALKKGKEIAERNDFDSLILTSQNEGEGKVVAKPLSGIAKEIQDSGYPMNPPAAVILGGETTVRFRSMDAESGMGGPNRELVLSGAMEIKNRNNIVFASVDSDGIDGMDKAGAIADTTTIQNSGLDPKEHLDRHDSQTFFETIDGNIEFESRTNVNDITVILVGEKE